MDSRLRQLRTTLFRSPEITETEEARMQEALRKSTQRFRAVDPKTQQQWSRLRRAIEQVDAKPVSPRSRLIPRLAFGGAVVAVVAAAVYLLTTSQQTLLETFTTRMGEQKEIVLGDGSQITLSYASEIVASEQRPDKPRRLSLTGDAYFKVRHTGTPFIVSTRSADVEVVGTEFNVRQRDGGVEIGVIDGAVKFRIVRDGKDSTLLLMHHQMAVCPRDGFPRRIGDISSPAYPGWMHGKLLLDKTSFLAACRELEMRFGVTITVHDLALREKVMTGILEARNPESGLAALCELTGKKFTITGRSYDVE
jgi:ferric-dicitrate binding protein FerR (iron transport regulator)